MNLGVLTLNNFGPYKGSQQLEFPQGDHTNVLVVFGDNMRGKTSLLNALRWVFHGEALGRQGEQLDLHKLVNREAAADGDWVMSVFVTFEASGRRYDLRRLARPREGILRPKGRADYSVEAILKIDGEVIRGDLLDHHINQVMPRQVARFSLFDGELLQEYEMLLYEQSEQGERIKRSIEQVLGVPALLQGRDELQTLLKRAQQRMARESKHVNGLEHQAAQYEEVTAEGEAAKRDATALDEKVHSLTKEIGELEEFLAQRAMDERALRDLEDCRRMSRSLAAEQQQLQVRRHEALEDAWRDLLRPRLELRIRRAEAEQASLSKALLDQGGLRQQVNVLEQLLKTGACGVCHRGVDEGQREALGADLGRLEGLLRQSKADVERLGAIAEQIRLLRGVLGTDAMKRVTDAERESSRLGVELTKIESRSSELEKQLDTVDKADIARKRTLRDRLLEIQGATKADLLRKKEQIDLIELKLQEISKLLKRSPDARLAQVRREVEVYSELSASFAEAVEMLRNRLRENVAHLATETFLQLTTEPDYARLEITDNYGLTIVDRLGRQVPLRSAGAEQVVALSLIAGLNRQSGKGLPMVMDTPLGRLDPRHRERILEKLPSMATQVVLLVHEGEIDPETGLDVLAARVGGQYQITRVSASHSVLQRVGA